MHLLWLKLYADFIEALDAHDNGISSYDPAEISSAGLQKRFADGGVSLGSLVGDLNPNWNDPAPADPAAAQVLEDAKFAEASELMGTTFMRKLAYYASAWLPARDLVVEAYKARVMDGQVMVFKGGLPWKDHLYGLEAEEEQKGGSASAKKAVYVLYPESSAPDAKWRIQAVPVSKDSFESRKPLPEAWRGMRDQELDKVSGVEGGVFVHASGFIGGNKTKEGAMKMAELALGM